MSELKGLLDSAKRKIGGLIGGLDEYHDAFNDRAYSLLGNAPQQFNAGAAAGTAGSVGDAAYIARLPEYMLAGSMPDPRTIPGTSDYIAAQAGVPAPEGFLENAAWIGGQLLAPGPGEIGAAGMAGGKLAMFLGAKAKTAMPDVLEYAQAMEKAGKSADEIWQTTGKLGQPWFKGADGKWRFEVDDSARFKSEPAKAALADTASGDVIPLSQLLGQEDEIARAYPDIGNVLFERTDAGGGLYYPPNKFGTEKIEVGSRDARSTALHEVMHPIQVREGFALGGLPANSSKSAEQEYFRLAAEAEARNVQHRADMTMEERLLIPPSVTQDVPTEQQIVRFGDGPAMAIEDFAARRAGKAKPYKESLPMDTASRMQRAQEMGFDTENPVYHGTRTKGEAIDAFSLDKAGSKTDSGYMGKGIYFGNDKTANAYAGHYEFDPGHFPEGGAVYPSYLSLKSPLILEDKIENGRSVDLEVLARDALGLPREATAEQVTQEALRQGYDGAIYSRGKGMYREYVAYNPEQIRSKFAAFDPSKKDSANLLAGLAALGVGTAAVKSQQDKERRNGL